MKLLSTTVKIAIIAAALTCTVHGEEVTLEQSDISKISSEAKKQIKAQKKEVNKSVRRKSSKKKTGR